MPVDDNALRETFGAGCPDEILGQCFPQAVMQEACDDGCIRQGQSEGGKQQLGWGSPATYR